MYYLVEVNKEKNNVNSQTILGYATLEEAIIAFHQSVAYAMSNNNVLYMARTILDEDLRYTTPQRIEVWHRPLESDSSENQQ